MSAADGVWLAYYPDQSGWRIFKSEIAALRFAVDTSMSITFLHYGEDPHDAVRK